MIKVYTQTDIPQAFETQFGTFNNYNHGEFASWLAKDDYQNYQEKGRSIFHIQGNYRDMFDCGKYSYAISNLTHGNLGLFKIIRIDQYFNAMVMYDNCINHYDTILKYVGRFENKEGYGVIASGCRSLECMGEKRELHDITVLFQIDENGNCVKSNEWEISLSNASSMAVVGDYLLSAQNEMVMRLNMLTGEIVFFTDKTVEDMAALEKIKR